LGILFPLRRDIFKNGELSRDYSFRDQIRRSAISKPSNIAEGLESGFDKQGIRFFYIAKGSIAELKTQLQLTKMIEYIKKDEFNKIFEDLERIGKMLYKLIAYRKNLNK
jgi:four helix bundle protein